MGWIATAAVLVALAVWLAVLLGRTRRVRRHFRILGEVAEVTDAGGSLPDTLDAICRVLIPQFADFGMVDVIDNGRARRATACVAPGCGPDVKRRLQERRPTLPTRMVEGNDAVSLEPRLYERISDEDLRELSRDAEDLDFLRSLGARSALTVALKARGRVTGALTLGVAWSGRRYRRDDARFARILSGRIALALDNSGLFGDLERAEREQAKIAATLQRDLLPLPLPHIPGWSLAAMYRPAGAENEVGGDFYDAFRVAGGWMLVIGDVTGRGAHAASITAQARYTLRTAAALTGDPLVALATLNRALLARGGSALCSLAALALSEDTTQPVRLAVAGHPPPLLVDGEAVTEATRADPVLGAFGDVEWRLRLTFLEPGQQLVVVTDGIVEARGREGRFGEHRLHAELAGAASPPIAVQRLEGALHSFTDGVLDDDVAILAIAPAFGERRAGVPIAVERTVAVGAARGNGDA
jgi:serine phosphatase RsbU (regulator of sigma subunit)